MAAPMRLTILINADGTAAIQGINRVRGEIGELDQAASRTASGGLSGLANQLKSLAMTAAAGIGVAAIATEFVAAATEAQKFEKSLTAVTGSSAAAAQEMEYIRATANKMGLTLADTANAYISLSAAAKGTALEGKATKDIFESVSLAMGKLGKSSADTQGALLALEQMISKGKVSAEELRGQLGERLPGAFKAAADAMGVTTAELDAMLAKGEVMAEDLLPALSQRLRELYDDGKEVGGLEAEWNRLTNALSAMASEADRATGITNALAGAIQYATGLANDWASAIRAVSNASQGLGFTMADRDELTVLYRKRTNQVNEYLEAVNRANNANSRTVGMLGAERDEALRNLAETERAIQSARQATRDAYNQQREDNAQLAASMMDGPVKAFRAQQAAQAEANQELLRLTGSYDKAAAKQAKIAEATTKYQEIAKSLGKDEAWVAEQVEKYTAGLEANTASHGRASKARGGTAKATKEASQAEREYQRAIAETERAVEGLISRYLPARKAAEEHAAAQHAVAEALAGRSGSVALSAEEASTILAGLARDQAEAADAARREADGFYAAWADAVDALDSTFQGLWRGLLSGQGDVLGDLKETVLEWIADLSYQLLLRPLVVPIQGALMGMLGGGAAGVTGTATSMLGMASNTGGMFNAFSSLSSLANGVSSLFSGAALTGIVNGFNAASGVIGASGYFGGFGANMAMASGAASAGSTSFAIGAALPYLAPAAIAIAVVGAIISKWQKDQEPRYGTLAAQTGGRVVGLEDWENGPGNYSRGSFGLTLGITDKGSKNMKASELKKTYDALAQVTDALAEFFGEDLTNFITEELKTLSTFGDGLIHLTENEGDLGAAMAMLVEHIALAAGRSSEDIGVAFAGMVGDLGGTAEEVGEQIQSAMMAAAMAVELSSRYDDRIGEMLSLTGEIGTDVDLLRGYIDQFGKSGELSGETLTRLVTQLGILDSAAEQTATDLAGLSTTALITLSDELVQAMGGVDRAASQMAFFYDQFTSASEKLADAVSAAADTIGREIPKLQDELMKLSEDVTTTVTTVVEDIQQGISGIELPSTGDSGNYWAGMRDKLVDRFGEDMASMLVSIQDQSTGVADGVNEYWAKMRDKLVDRFGEDLVRMIDVVHGTAENAVRSIAIESEKVTKTITTETTVKGDPNAAILASLLNELPKTRQGFEDLISAIDLTTEAGRKLYAGLMELAPQFDLLYDGVEAFTDWLLGVNEVERATRELERVFQDLGLVMPQNRDALLELYQSGALSAEQMAVLAAYLKELGLVFDQVAEDVEELKDGISQLQLDRIKRAYSGLDQAANAEREVINTTYQARMDAIAAEREVIDQQHQDRLAAIASERDAANSAYQSRLDAIAAEREALAEANRAQLDALSKQREAAQEALSIAQAGLNRIQSALSFFRSESPRSELERMRSLRQLGSWAASGRLPEEDALDRAITGATNLDAQNFTSENAYRAAQGSAYSALLALEKVGIKQVSDAEKQIQAIEKASERAQDSYEKQLKAIDAQAEQAAAQRDATLEILARQEESAIAWRDQELARLDAEAEAATAWRDANLASIDALLAEATKQIAILEGTYIETKTIAAALAELNAALIDAGGEPLQPVQAGLADMLPPLEDIALAESATTNEVIILRQEIVTLRKDLAAVNTSQVVALKSIDERLRKWDMDGLPDSTSSSDTALRAA
jgi:tape measure domain-containing protein